MLKFFRMIAALSWIPRGYAKQIPEKYDATDEDVKQWMEQAGYVVCVCAINVWVFVFSLLESSLGERGYLLCFIGLIFKRA